MSRPLNGRVLGGVLALALVPAAASAQSTIAGVVKDATGAVLPGVTVEASSPALIEKTRTAVTNGEGRYAIVDTGEEVWEMELPGAATAPSMTYAWQGKQHIVVAVGWTDHPGELVALSLN